MLDPADRLLLIEDSDLGMDPVVHWWITPGGGVEAGESDREAAVREVREEVGLTLTAAQLLGPIGIRQVVHGYSDQVALQDEIFFAVRVEPFEIDTSGQTADEQQTVHDIAWWTPEELATTAQDIWPRCLPALLACLNAHQQGAAPVTLPDSEESTLPA